MTFDNEEEILRILTNITKILEKLNKTFQGNKIWIRKVKQQPEVRKHLEQLRDKCQSDDIRFHAAKLLRGLTTPSQNLKGKDQLLSKLTDAYIRFGNTAVYDSHTIDELMDEVTKDILTALKSFQQDNLLAFIFLATSLKKQGFDFSNMSFRYNLSENSTNDLRKDFKRCIEYLERFWTIARGTVDIDRSIDCLKYLINNLKAISECTEFLGISSDYLSKEPRVQDFLEVVAKHFPKTKDEKKASLRQLLSELIDSEYGIKSERVDIFEILQEREEKISYPGYSRVITPTYDPPVPYTRMIPGGLDQGSMIFIEGNPKGSRFTINLSIQSEPALHFDVRFSAGNDKDVLVRNTMQNGKWGQEERDVLQFPFIYNKPFKLLILCDTRLYKVALDNEHLLVYKHRVPPECVDRLNITGDVQLKRIIFQLGEICQPVCERVCSFCVLKGAHICRMVMN